VPEVSRRAKAAALLAAQVLVLLLQPLTAYAANNTTNPLQKAVNLANTVADALKKLAYTIIVIAAFIGAINYAFGKGPEWLGRAALAAIALSAVLWLIGQFMG
jgi:membrane protein YdbS with pleckstrin-like domain